jgi:hypothetical protein
MNNYLSEIQTEKANALVKLFRLAAKEGTLTIQNAPSCDYEQRFNVLVNGNRIESGSLAEVVKFFNGITGI